MFGNKLRLKKILVILSMGLLVSIFYGHASAKSGNILRMSFTKPASSESYFLLMRESERIEFSFTARLEEGEMLVKILSSEGKVLNNTIIKAGDVSVGSIAITGLNQEEEYIIRIEQNSSKASSIEMQYEPKTVFFYKDKEDKVKYLRMTDLKNKSYHKYKY